MVQKSGTSLRNLKLAAEEIKEENTFSEKEAYTGLSGNEFGNNRFIKQIRSTDGDRLYL